MADQYLPLADVKRQHHNKVMFGWVIAALSAAIIVIGFAIVNTSSVDQLDQGSSLASAPDIKQSDSAKSALTTLPVDQVGSATTANLYNTPDPSITATTGSSDNNSGADNIPSITFQSDNSTSVLYESQTTVPSDAPQIPQCYPSPNLVGLSGASVTEDQLQPTSGIIELTEPGQIYEMVHVQGRIEVYAPNVTIRKSKISYDGSGLAAIENFSNGLVIEDTEIVGSATRSGHAISGQNYAASRININGFQNSLSLSSNTEISDSYIKSALGGTYAVAAEGASDIKIKCNTIEHTDSAGSALPGNALLVHGQTLSDPSTNIEISGNYLAGGDWTFSVVNALNVLSSNNTWSEGDWNNGPVEQPLGSVGWFSWSNNKLVDGQAVPKPT